MASAVKMKKGSSARLIINGFLDNDYVIIPAGFRLDSVIAKKVGTTAGNLTLGTTGRENIASFLKKGYVEIKRPCPHQPFFGKCNPKKCGFYVIKNGTGDCLHIWLGVERGIIK